MSGTTKYQYLPREFVSVEALIQVVYNSALAFTFCFDLESLKVSQKWQPRAFLGLHEHVHSLCMCWPSGFPEINQDFFKALRDNAFPSLFYQAFSLIHCFLPQVLSPLAAATKIFAHKYYKKTLPAQQLQHQTSSELGIQVEVSMFFQKAIKQFK